MRQNNKARAKRGALGNRTNAASDKRDVTQAQNTWKAAPALAMLQRYATFSCCFWGKNVKEKIKMFVLSIEKKPKQHVLEWIKLKVQVWLNVPPPTTQCFSC